jgi:flagellar basal-body rod protein FlgF
VIYGVYQSAAGMLTNQLKQAVIANNLANADTVGFKQEMAVFAERPPEILSGPRTGPSDPKLADLTGGLWLGQTQTDFRPGALITTQNPTDLAIDGPGFFVVQVNGQPQYTRDGRFVAGPDGVLSAATDGAPVVGVGGAQILVNRFGGQITVDEEGRVFQNGGPRGQLALADFADYGALQHTQGARFVADEAVPVAPPSCIRSGVLENAAVEPVTELVNMIEASRSFELNARMVGLQDQTTAKLIGCLDRNY